MRNSFVTKTDLGQAFFPFISPRSARQKLMQLIAEDSDLMESLVKNGYVDKSHTFSPKQVEVIISRLGNPFK